MYRVVLVGGPPAGAARTEHVNMALTAGEIWRFLGTMTFIGTVIYLIDGDPGGLVAAAVIGALLWQANRRDGWYAD